MNKKLKSNRVILLGAIIGGIIGFIISMSIIKLPIFMKLFNLIIWFISKFWKCSGFDCDLALGVVMILSLVTVPVIGILMGILIGFIIKKIKLRFG